MDVGNRLKLSVGKGGRSEGLAVGNWLKLSVGRPTEGAPLPLAPARSEEHQAGMFQLPQLPHWPKLARESLRWVLASMLL